MGLIYEIVRQERRGLKLFGWNNSIDVDLLVAVGSVTEVHTSYVGMANFGQAYNFRYAAERGVIRVFDESETTAIGRFRAGSMGEPFHVSYTPLFADVAQHEMAQVSDPFTGEPVTLLRAWRPHVAIIHAHTSDDLGNVQLDDLRMMDNETDVLVAKSADVVVVSVEQIVSRHHVMEHPQNTILPGFLVDYVVELPFGAHPTSCDRRYDWDGEFFGDYQRRCRNGDVRAFLDEFMATSHEGYLERLGMERLVALSHGV